MIDRLDYPMPKGIEDMTKQQLWNYFERYREGVATQTKINEFFFGVKTGLDYLDFTRKKERMAIIEMQRQKIEGLRKEIRGLQKYIQKMKKESL